jgi:dipeptidyl aminopeptidase/acylaminoacyl peptidase
MYHPTSTDRYSDTEVPAMKSVVKKSLRLRHPMALVIALVVALGSSHQLPAAGNPTGKALTADDYTRWRSITGAEISDDGKWVTYVLQVTNVAQADAKPELHVRNLETGQDTTIPNATGGAFSPDSQWIAYLVDTGAGRRGRDGAAGAGESGTENAATAGAAPPPPARRGELRHLSTGVVRSWQDIQSFAFNATSTHLFLRRRPPAPARGGAAGAGGGGGAPSTPPADTPGGSANAAAGDAPAGPRGVDVILFDLGAGRHQLLGSVGDIAFNKKGDLLAYTVDSPVRDGNGLFVFDTARARTTTLDTDAKSYNRLTWSEDGTALAVLKGADVDKMRERDHQLMAYRNVPAVLADPAIAAKPAILDRARMTGLPAGWVISDRSALTWSEDDTRVFFGVKEQVAARPAGPARPDRDTTVDVDVWNSEDERIQSVQMIRAEADRNFTFRQAFDVSSATFVKLADETMRDLDVSKDGRWAVGRDTRGYIHDHKRPAADLYRVNTRTGERTLVVKNQLIGSHVLGISSDGRHFLYWKDHRFQAYDLDAGTTKALGNGSAASFVDMEFDRPGPKPSYGIAGYTSDGKGVIVNQRYDLWLLPFDGSAPSSLTGGTGTKNEIRFRYVRTEQADTATPPGGDGAARPGGGGPPVPREPIDLSKPITLSTYGEYTKKAGFSEWANGQLKELVFEDASFSTPTRARRAEKFLFTRQTFIEFPDLRVSGPAFKDARQLTDANPQQAEYLWGRRILFDYKNKDGKRLQGILALPDDYKPGEKRPMLVTFYEKNSQNMHRYSAPSYLTGMGASPIEAVTRGYITMLPDIHFRTGSSHSDMLECVEAATRKVIELGYADPKRIGITGHSYGGEGAAFIGTQSKLFAAIGMGAGVTDLFSDFSQNWGWAYQVTGGSGANGNDYYLYGQGRWGVSPWDDPERYHFESALTHAPKVTAPFLIMHGTADPTVAFQNGLGFYNALRYNNKTAILLAYPGEGHGLRGMANRKDLTIRYFQFFDHYLKGAPAPKWMTDGVPFLKKNEKEKPITESH